MSAQFTTHQITSLLAAIHLDPFDTAFLYMQAPMEHNPNPNPNYIPDSDEAEERLSFCDLPMYSDVADWENLYTQDQTSYSSSEQDYFEFFGDEWNTTTDAATTYPPRNIIFCGKLITYKESVSCEKSRHELENNEQQKHEKRGLFRWNLSSFTKRKTMKSGKSDDKCGFKVQKVKLVTSPSKSRWYLFMFGLARFPTEMELKDMKRRRNRQAGPTLFWSDGGGDKSRGKGWGLVRALGCGSGGQYTDAVVKASLGGTL